MSYAVTVRDELHKPTAPDPAVHLADWLVRRGLRFGYGPFWDASIVTVSSGGRVAVRPIFVRPVSPERHTIVPLPWMVDARWFTDEPATFVVIEPGPLAAYQFGVTERNCAVTFGPPAGRYEVGPYAVLVWDHDLRSQRVSVNLEVRRRSLELFHAPIGDACFSDINPVQLGQWLQVL